MLNSVTLAELSRQRQRDVARTVALCRYVRSPRVTLGRMLVALGGRAVFAGLALGQESERKPQITVA